MALTLDEILSKSKTLFSGLDLQHVYLFGSYARGEETEESDIDIYIDFGHPKLLRSDWYTIGEAYERVKKAFNKEVDVIVFPKEPLYEEIKSHMIQLF